MTSEGANEIGNLDSTQSSTSASASSIRTVPSEPVNAQSIDIGLVCDPLQEMSNQCEQNSLPISFVATNDGVLDKSLNHLDPTFMYTQIMKKIFLTIDFDQNDYKTFIEYCRVQFAGNPDKLKNVNDLEKDYVNQSAIWWYTSDTFLFSMLNAALRAMNGEIMMKMGFFIKDLHRQIQQLHSEQIAEYPVGQIFTLYRGQVLPKVKFEEIQKTMNGLMSFNNFLSTSKNRDVSIDYANKTSDDPESVRILFVMTIDPSLSSAPFVSVNKVGSVGGKEAEILFSMHSVFRINDIEPMGEDSRLFQVNLTLTSDNDEDLRKLTARMEQDTYPEEVGWFRVGCVLLLMGQPKTAEEVFQNMLEQPMEESKKGKIYRSFGLAKYKQGQYEEALKLYDKSIETDRMTFPPDHRGLAKSYNNIGLVYNSMGDYPRALSYYEEALTIKQQSLPPNHPSLAKSYNNIGLAYYSMGDYPKALWSHENALAIRNQSLPFNHPDLAASYSNLGSVHHSMGDYPKALWSHENALAIQQQSLPSNHPDVAKSYMNIGNVCYSMGDYSKALSSHEQALAIQQQSLPSNHPDLTASYGNIGNVSYSMGDYSKALSSHEKALAARQQSLPPTHPDLAASYNCIGLAYEGMDDYRNAQWNYGRAVTIAEQSLEPNHPNLQMYRKNLADIEEKL